MQAKFTTTKLYFHVQKEKFAIFLQIQKGSDHDAFWVTFLKDKHNKNVEVLNAVNFALFTHTHTPHPPPTHTHTKLLPRDQFAVSSSYFSILLINMYFQKYCLKLHCQLFPGMSFPKVTFSHFFLEADWPYEYTFHKQWNWGFLATTGRGCNMLSAGAQERHY